MGERKTEGGGKVKEEEGEAEVNGREKGGRREWGRGSRQKDGEGGRGKQEVIIIWRGDHCPFGKCAVDYRHHIVYSRNSERSNSQQDWQ